MFNSIEVSLLGISLRYPQALGFAQSTRVGQRRVDRVNKRTELRRLCFDIDPHGELAERDAAHRADRSNERSAETLFKLR